VKNSKWVQERTFQRVRFNAVARTPAITVVNKRICHNVEANCEELWPFPLFCYWKRKRIWVFHPVLARLLKIIFSNSFQWTSCFCSKTALHYFETIFENDFNSKRAATLQNTEIRARNTSLRRNSDWNVSNRHFYQTKRHWATHDLQGGQFLIIEEIAQKSPHADFRTSTTLREVSCWYAYNEIRGIFRWNISPAVETSQPFQVGVVIIWDKSQHLATCSCSG